MLTPPTLIPRRHYLGEGLGLDSIDALEIGAALSKRYRIKIKSQDEKPNSILIPLNLLPGLSRKRPEVKGFPLETETWIKSTMFEKLRDLLEDEFDIDRGNVTLDALLYEDLGLDSIDAVDLMAWIVKLTGKRMSPEDFRNVRTVRDVIDKLEEQFS